MSKPILLIDDEEKFAQMLQELLELNGFASEYCLNPEKALSRLHRENYDLVITDYKMPEMDGAQFLQEARKIHPDLPVIMISGLMNMPELIKVANIGVTLVLEKPFKTEDLMEHVTRFVRPQSDQGSTASARGMEASEINFSSESISVSYPSPAESISDASNENKRFLETLWQSANVSRHLPFYASPGAEVRLVAEEVLGWIEHSPGEEVVRIDLVDTKTDFTRSWILEHESFPEILLVDMRESQLNEECLSLLREWVEFVETSGRDLSLSRILYVLPTGASFKIEDLELPEELQQLFASDFPVLLSLRGRLPDIATYICRLLKKGERDSLGREAMLQLLHYSWPGGYKEVKERIGSLRVRIQSGEEINPQQVREILAERSEDAKSLESELNLAGYLKRRQREYLLMYREPGEDIKDTLLRFGVEAKDLDSKEITDDAVLIYPEIANEIESE